MANFCSNSMMDEVKSAIAREFEMLSSDDLELLLDGALFKSYPAKSHIPEMFPQIRYLGFIYTGIVRGYRILDSGEERTLILRPEGLILGAPESLANEKSTEFRFEAIHKTDLLFFDLERFRSLAMSNLNFSLMWNAILTENLKTVFFRVELLAGMSPEERYERLLKERPILFQKSYLKYVANYLGITPNSLSRIASRKVKG